MTLRQVIAEEIRARGPIPFSRYMQLCLYHPDLGYYSRAEEKFGKAGDFYTSSDVHAVFGRLLCRQFDEMWRALGAPARIDLIELGPGRGLFAQDVLAWAGKKFPDFLAALHYTLVESSPSLRSRLQEKLADQVARGNVAIVAELDPAPRDGAIVFANEFFDAVPVEVVAPEGRLLIALADASQDAASIEPRRPFVEDFGSIPADIDAFLDRYGVRPGEHERTEAIPAYREHVERIAGTIGRGFAIVIDYGYTRDEQLAGRHRGTVTSFRRHTVSDSPYDAPGEQDITAHVNFTAVSGLAREFGLDPQPLITQSQFLLGIGEPNQFADAFSDCRLPQEHAKVALQLKHLVTPAGMGEDFRVLVLSRGVERDSVIRVSGLSFGAQR